MPYLSSRILVSPCPFVNLDLFKKGYYHVACRLVDTQAEQLHSRVSCLAMKDLFGPNLSDHTFPGACINAAGDCFITQTLLVNYTEQTFLLGECFVFQLDIPLRTDHTEVYIPSHLSIQLDLMFSKSEEMPDSPSEFKKVSSRTVSLNIDWRKGLHDYFPVLFGYYHLSAVGLTVHASLFELNLDEYSTERPQVPQKKRLFHPTTPASIPRFHDLATILFGAHSQSPTASSSERQALYEVPTKLIQRAQDAHQMLSDVLRSARDSLHIGHAIMSGEQLPPSPQLESGSIASAGSLREAEDICRRQVTELSVALTAAWEWFCNSAVVHPEMLTFLATRSHCTKLALLKQSIVAQDSPHFKSITNINDPICQARVAGKIRRMAHVSLPLYCQENIESPLACSVVFIEPCPWETPAERTIRPVVAPSMNPRDAASRSEHVRPYFLNALPHADRSRRPGVHLVICLHGLQGNQFDLRLYRIFLQLALPQVRFDFLMAQANQSNTFCDFNDMTDRLLVEILDYVHDMPTPPTKVSFIGHSLGTIIARSLVTRPDFASLQPKLHLLLSVCGPHLGTQFQKGIISMGMWAVQKWYSSKSLLQLSLKDAPNPRDAFLYHLSEAPSFEYFRHVILLCSPQDKYVPYQSAKVATIAQDGSLQSTLGLEMMQNILEPMREAKVNLVRVSVDHSAPASANSAIGRAAHIAMLDNELFIEKFVTLHLAQYFVE